jgi:hypothetical protein
MKKFAWFTAVLLIAAVLAFVGCNNGTTDDVESKGVLGQVSGVVYDGVTGQPLEGATVAIGGYEPVTTTKAGTYSIPDVIPNTELGVIQSYTLSISKEGYGFYTQEVRVDPKEYADADPFKDWDNIDTQIALFTEWIESQGNSIFPDSDIQGGASGEWTYENGVFVSGDGETTVTIDGSSSNDFPQFKVVENKLSYTYRYGVPVHITRLQPLTGGFTGKINLIFDTYNSAWTQPVNGTAAIKAGVEIYFVDADEYEVAQNGDHDETTRIYGPFVTNADGTFTADKLPAATELAIFINPFYQEFGGIAYYFEPFHLYSSADWTDPINNPGSAPAAFETLAGNEEVPAEEESADPTRKGYRNLGELHIFTTGTVAFITGGNVPNANAPFAVSGSTISLTFNRPIKIGSFSANLTINAGANGLGAGPEVSQALSAEWTDDKTVTLTPAEKLPGYSKISFPYSAAATAPVGWLNVQGFADDGSPIYAATNGIPVYTVEGIKLTGVEYIAKADAPTRAAVQIGGAVKLTFSKDLDPNYAGNKFEIDDILADYRFVEDEPASVYIYADQEVTAAADVTFAIAALGDTGDQLADSIGEKVTVGATNKLVLLSTNLYTGLDGVNQKPTGEASIFPVDGTISFTFASIPADSKASIELRKDAGTTVVYTPSAVIAGNTVSVPLATALLDAGTIYSLKLRIVQNGVTLYDTPAEAGAKGPLYTEAAYGIVFKTSDQSRLTLLNTNLYTDINDVSYAPADDAEIFPKDRAITFTFNEIPADAKVSAKLVEGSTTIYTAVAVAGNTVTVTPAALRAGTTYGIDLRITKDGLTLYNIPEASGEIKGLLYVDDDGAIFMTSAADRLVLLKSNLYINPLDNEDAKGSADDLFYFAPDADLEFTFDTLPADAILGAVLRDASNNILAADVTKDDATKTVKVNPVNNLQAGKIYYLRLRVSNALNEDLWTVANGLTGIDTSQAFAGDSLWYIGFSTQKPAKATLVSTNLYKDGDVTNNYDAPYFKLNDSITLTFYDIPAGTTVKTVELGTTTNAVAANIIDTSCAPPADNKVTIKPVKSLDANTPYYLRLVLAQPNSADLVWEPIAPNDTTGENGPIYVQDNGTKDEIYFRTVNDFALRARTEASSVTNVSAGLTGFDATKDIVLEFNKPIASVQKVELRHWNGVVGSPIYYDVTAQVTAANLNDSLSPDKKVLTIKTDSLLAPSRDFHVRFKLTSDDGQILVYDATDVGDTADYVGNTRNSDIRFSTSATEYLTGLPANKQVPQRGGTLSITSAVPVPNNGQTLDVELTDIPAATSFSQDYEIFQASLGVWVGRTPDFTVPQGEVEGTADVDLSLPAGHTYLNSEVIQFKARGVDNKGYAIETNTLTINFD